MATVYYGPAFGPGTTKAQAINKSYNQAASSGRVAGPVNPSSGLSQPKGGSVLGAPTGPSSSGGSSSPASSAPSNNNSNNNSAPSQPDFSQEISDAYAPALAALESAIGVANSGADTQIASTEGNYNNAVSKVDTESAQLKADTEGRQADFNKTLQSAYEDAVRAYNALKQQGISRFGGGSSAGQAVGELANQEYFKQQGNIQQNQAKGDLQFAGEFGKIGTYVAQKKQDLLQWKNDTLGSIKQNLAQTLQDIAMRKGDIESNKTKDKIAALQVAQQRVQQVQDADTSFRQSLAVSALNNMQTIAGRAFTPAEIKATLVSFGLTNIGGGAITGNAGVTAGKSNDQYDAFGNLINATG